MEGESLEEWQPQGSSTVESGLQMDSRTAAFDRKRPFIAVDNDKNADVEDVRAANSAKPSVSAPNNGQAPPISWNSGARSRIRTTLGAIRPTPGEIRPRVPNSTTPILLPPQFSHQLVQGTPEPIIRDSSIEDSDTNDRVILNLEERDQSEPHQPQPRPTGDLGLFRDTAVAEPEKDGSSDEGEVYSNNEADTVPGAMTKCAEEEQQTDAMMIYSTSNPDEYTHSYSRSDNSVLERPSLQILADLDPDELKEQLKYFYAVKVPKGIDLNDPVRCLTCSKEGHITSVCPSLVCQSCQKVKDHFTRDCPKNRRCEKCRNKGHDKENCPYKLSHLDGSEIECDLCQRTGHTEAECELQWRTSGRPWESDINAADMIFYCYECGRSSHLGNDCPSRNPRKAMGTSTWSGKVPKGLPIRGGQSFRNGLAIKGRAQQKNSGDRESEDDPSDFIRPRIIPPTRRGEIQVLGRSSMPKPDNQSGVTPQAASTIGRGSASDVGRGHRNRRGRNARNDDALDPVRLGGLRVGGRVDRYIRDANPVGDSYRPPPSPRQPPARQQDGGRNAQGANSYRPMPSAAQSAWKKRRT